MQKKKTFLGLKQEHMNDKEYQDWEKKIDKAKQDNNSLLSGFEKWLETKALKPKTIDNHLRNIDFYVNHFLLYYDIIPPEEGVMKINLFLSDFFVRKAMWANKSSVLQNITSLKKFYTYLHHINKMDGYELRKLKFLIKEEKQNWIKNVEAYWLRSYDDW